MLPPKSILAITIMIQGIKLVGEYLVPSSSHNLLLKVKLYWALCIELMTGNCKLTTAFMATDINCTAAALTEHLAAFVSFQWKQASFPPTLNVNSAVSPALPAVQFGGSIAINAATAAITATFVTFSAYGNP